MRAFKLAGIALGTTAALVLAVVVVLNLVFSSARLKSALAEAVLEKTQRTLTIDGDIALSFQPGFGIAIGKARLSEPHSVETFAAIDSARIGIEVLPLLSRQLVAGGIEIDGARLALVKRKDGSLNIDDLLTNDPAGQTAPVTPAAPWSLDITAVKLTNAWLSWRDEGGSESPIGAGLDLATGRIVGDTGSGDYSVDALTLALGVASGDHKVAIKLGLPRLALSKDRSRTVTLDRLEGGIELASPKLQRPVSLPLAGRLSADLDRKSVDGTLSSRLDDSTIALQFAIARFAPLDLRFALDIDRLDADRYLAPDDGADANGGGIDLSALQGLDLHGSLRIGELQLANVRSRNIRLVVGDGR